MEKNFIKYVCLLSLLFIPASISAQKYVLVWSDEFDGTSIDTSNWNHQIGGGGWGNNELQYYTADPENSRVENGFLIIEARKFEVLQKNSGFKHQIEFLHRSVPLLGSTVGIPKISPDNGAILDKGVFYSNAQPR